MERIKVKKTYSSTKFFTEEEELKTKANYQVNELKESVEEEE